jgi:catechol 2,3-dioxygenase
MIGTVRLNVSDLDGQQAFYERAIGLHSLERTDDLVRLGPEGGPALVELAGRPDAPPRPPRSTGLFHLAILVPNRLELARALPRLAQAGHGLTGASDHLVSEALYLRDPEGNGIEIYRDRPREKWPRDGDAPRMDTLPLDLDGVLGELDAATADGDGVPAATRIGHVHLQVADVAAAEAFYHGALGLDVTVRSYPGALFLSHGGYHHHVGVNTWASAGAPPPPTGALGLDWFELVMPQGQPLERAGERLRAAGAPAEPEDRGLLAADPSGNRVLLRPAGVAL